MLKDIVVEYGIMIWQSFPSFTLRLELGCHFASTVLGSKLAVSFIYWSFYEGIVDAFKISLFLCFSKFSRGRFL